MDIKDCHWVFLFYRGHRPLSSIPKRLSLPYSKREQAQNKEVNGLRNGINAPLLSPFVPVKRNKKRDEALSFPMRNA